MLWGEFVASWKFSEIAVVSENGAGGGPHSWSIPAAYVKAPETTLGTVKVNKESRVGNDVCF